MLKTTSYPDVVSDSMPDLVISASGNIVLVTGEGDERVFAGVVIHPGDTGSPVGRYSETFAKSEFRQYRGRVEIISD